METSEEKTKRKIIKELTKQEYRYRSAIFFTDYTPDIFDYAANIRKVISRKIGCQIFWLVRAKRVDVAILDIIPADHKGKSIVQPYIQFFTKDKMNVNIINEVLFTHHIHAVCKCMQFTDSDKDTWLDTFKRQRMINLKPFIEKSNVKTTPRRWTMTNKIVL